MPRHRAQSGTIVRQRSGSRSAAFLLVALAAALVVTPARPRAGQTPQQPIRVETNFVRVDVYPTEDGKIVPDLRAEDFEIFEDGVAQGVKAFEFIVIRSAGPQSERVEPNTVAQSTQMAANPRNRVFVVFLDVGHVNVAGSHAIQGPLIRLLDRTLGADDLVAVMTPDMSPNQLAFGRKTEILARGLNENWPWGMRHSITPMDKSEKDYEDCYSGYDNGQQLIDKMKDRRRERLTLDAFRDLVIYLGNLREERKAILTVTEGWLLYRPDPDMAKLLKSGQYTEPEPGIPANGVGPGRKVGKDNSRKYFDDSKTKAYAERSAWRRSTTISTSRTSWISPIERTPAFIRSIRAGCRSGTTRSALDRRRRRPSIRRCSGRGWTTCRCWP